jgi:hypothetical protein
LGLPHPLNRMRACPPPFVRGGGGLLTRLRERGWGGSPNSDEGTDTVVL